MHKRFAVVVVGVASLGFVGGAARADTGPSGSGYTRDNFYGGRDVQCSAGERVDGPSDLSVSLYDGPNGREVCVQQRDADGSVTGPTSGRAWITSDGALHADLPLPTPFAGFIATAQRTEVDIDGDTVRTGNYFNDEGYGSSENHTTYEPLEGHIHSESTTDGSASGSSSSDTWIGAEGYRSESSSSEYNPRFFTSSAQSSSVGADGVHFHQDYDYYEGYYHQGRNYDLDADSNGVRAAKGDADGYRYEGTVVSMTPSGGLIVLRQSSGYDLCSYYGTSEQGVRWNPIGDPGSLPTVVDTDDRPPCP